MFEKSMYIHRPARCTTCGDTEPFHVHDGDRRIEDYFTIGRGMSDLGSALAWKRRALSAERQLEEIIGGSSS